MPAFYIAALLLWTLAKADYAPVDIWFGGGHAPVAESGIATAEFSPRTNPDNALLLTPSQRANFSWSLSRNVSAPISYRLVASQSIWTGTGPITNTSVSLWGIRNAGIVPTLQSPQYWGASVSCGDQLVLIFTATWFFWSASTGQSYEPLSVSWLWRCVPPGCRASCEVDDHGVCNTLEGHCTCRWPYAGIGCDVILRTPALDAAAPSMAICPDSFLSMQVQLPDYGVPEAWYSVWGGVDDMTLLEWGYFASNSWQKPDDASIPLPIRGNLTIVLTLPPGVYEIDMYNDNDGNEANNLATIPLYVSDWATDGCAPANASLLTCESDEYCGGTGHGLCVNETCECLAGHFWFDCSRGCGVVADDGITTVAERLTARSGIVASDPGARSAQEAAYILNSECRWIIAPIGNYDVIRLDFQLLDIGEGDFLAITDGETGEFIEQLLGTWAIPPTREYARRSLALHFASDSENVRHGFRFSYTAPDPPLSAAVKAAIAVPVTVAVVAVAALAAVIAALSVRRRRQLQSLQSVPAEVWKAEAAERQSEGDAVAALAALERKGVTLSKRVLTFGLAAAEPCPVQKDVTDHFDIRNTSYSAVRFRVYVPDGGYEFETSLVPGRGVIPARSAVKLGVRFRLLYTTKVARQLRIDISRSSSDCTTVTAAFDLEGAISDYLNPADITLEPVPLGQGSFGAVYRGMYRGRLIAVKVVKKQQFMSEAQLGEFHREIDLYTKLRSPFVVDFVGASHLPGRLCLCVELMEHGSLDALICDFEIAPALQIKFLWDVALAMDFLHSRNVLYRDLKPGNVLVASTSLSAKANCKIGDFGTARNVERVTEICQYTNGMGTPIYMAPELFMPLGYNHKVDQYSYAITMWQMATRDLPWRDFLCWEIPEKVVTGVRPPVPPNCSPDYARVMTACWAPKAADRPDFADIAATMRDLFAAERAVLRSAKPKPKKLVKKPSPITEASNKLAPRGQTISSGASPSASTLSAPGTAAAATSTPKSLSKLNTSDVSEAAKLIDDEASLFSKGDVSSHTRGVSLAQVKYKKKKKKTRTTPGPASLEMAPMGPGKLEAGYDQPPPTTTL